MKVLGNWHSWRMKRVYEEEINLKEFLNSRHHVGIYLPKAGHFLPGSINTDYELAVVAQGHFDREKFEPTRGIQLTSDRPYSALMIDIKKLTLTPAERFLRGDSDKIDHQDRFFYWGNMQELIREFGREGFTLKGLEFPRLIN